MITYEFYTYVYSTINYMKPVSDIQTTIVICNMCVEALSNMCVEKFHLKYFILRLSSLFENANVPFIHFY